MPDHLGEDMRKTKTEEVKEEKDIKGKFFCLLFSRRYFGFLRPKCNPNSVLLNSS